MTQRSKRSPFPEDGIRRRDFVNGVLVAAGGAALGRFMPGCKPAPVPDVAPPEGMCDGSIGSDPRAQRGATLPAAFNVGHLLRDRRLTFGQESVTVAALSCDSLFGTMPIIEDGGDHEVIIVGSGVSALASAFFLTKQRKGTKILMLDANNIFGGNAGRDDLSPIPMVSSTGGAYAVAPYNDILTEIYTDIGIDWTKSAIPAPLYSYYFDEQTPYILPGKKGWNIDTYGAGLKDMPYSPKIIADFEKARQDFIDWASVDGGPTDPADDADPKFDYLAQITLDEYLTKTKGYDPAVSDFYTRYTIDALAGTASQVNAFSSISFIEAEYGDLFALPGGTSGIARHILKWLIPSAIAGTSTDEIIQNPFVDGELDNRNNPVRVRQSAVVMKVDTEASSASVIYMHGGVFYRARAKAVIVAGQAHTARHIVSHLIDNPTKEAFSKIIQVPVVVANVVLKSAESLVNLGIGYDAYWWGSKYWADFVISDWVTPNRTDPKRETVLSLYGGNIVEPAGMAGERIKLLETPFSDYEASVKDDLNRVLKDGGFDYDKDVSALYVYRWGHGMVFPEVGIPFGPPGMSGGMPVRTDSPRHVMRKQLGRISFAGQDTESTPAMESAIASGSRAAGEVLPLL